MQVYMDLFFPVTGLHSAIFQNEGAINLQNANRLPHEESKQMYPTLFVAEPVLYHKL